MCARLSKVEEWILSAMALEHQRSRARGDWGERVWDTAFIVDRIPQNYIDELKSTNHIDAALINLIKAQLVDEQGGRAFPPRVMINREGIFAFRKFLSPLAKTMEDKKSFRKILDDTPGNPEIREALKKLPDELKDRIAKEGVDALIKIGIKYGTDAAFYLIELARHVD